MAVHEYDIRPARAEDETAIRVTVRAARLMPFQLHWYNFVVVEEKGEILGVGQVRPHKDCRELASIAVRPEAQGRGFGRRIVEKLLEREEGVLHLMCLAEMESFYNRFGFQRMNLADAPPSLALKIRLGNIIMQVAGWFGVDFGQAIVMVREPATAHG